MDWDDIRFFLAVAREGSIRSASLQLSVNPSTVARRIDGFEKKIAVRLFERLPTGYVLTKTGHDMVASAELIENEVAALDRKVTGRDTQLNGVLRITLPAPLVTHLLIDDFAKFEQTYPGIQLDLHVSYDVLNLSKREADVAIRITNEPSDYLVGKKVANLSFAMYGAKHYLAKFDLQKQTDGLQKISYLANSEQGEVAVTNQYDTVPTRHVINDPFVIFESTKAGMGIARLPCFMADPEPNLQRISDVEAKTCGDIWLLTHKDLRSTARVKVFVDFMTTSLERHNEKLQGKIEKNASTFLWRAQEQSA